MTQQITHAQPCKTVQKEEWINTILREITVNPKITNNDLAEKYQVTRNRISRYRNIIRRRQLVTNTETINKIDGIIEDRLPDMEDRDLINLRRQFVPQEIAVTHTKIDIRKQVTELISISHVEVEECNNNNKSQL